MANPSHHSHSASPKSTSPSPKMVLDGGHFGLISLGGLVVFTLGFLMYYALLNTQCKPLQMMGF